MGTRSGEVLFSRSRHSAALCFTLSMVSLIGGTNNTTDFIITVLNQLQVEHGCQSQINSGTKTENLDKVADATLIFIEKILLQIDNETFHMDSNKVFMGSVLIAKIAREHSGNCSISGTLVVNNTFESFLCNNLHCSS